MSILDGFSRGMCPCQASHAGLHGPNGEKDEEAHDKTTQFCWVGPQVLCHQPLVHVFLLWQ